MQDFEKLGVFYLGKNENKDDLLLYDSKDLVTHAVCVGMTGSGKTGLCINRCSKKRRSTASPQSSSIRRAICVTCC
jgi:hypothetical protein